MMASEGREVGEVGKEQQLLRTRRVEQVTPSNLHCIGGLSLEKGHWLFILSIVAGAVVALIGSWEEGSR
jgi:hypothetical protein